jgi:1-phosphofructokinase
VNILILTVTMNPAVDKTIKISDLKVDQVNRVDSIRIDAGGKGINVSKTIKELQGSSIALGIIGGNSGGIIQEYLNNAGIENDLVRIQGETRTNSKIVDVVNKTHTDINEIGPTVTAEDIASLKAKILEHSKKDTIIVLSGSVPMGVADTIYKEIIEEANKLKAKVILDADKDLFAEAVKAGPFMVKPNIDELERAFNRKIADEAALIEVSRSLLEYGIKYVVVSLGGEGSMVISESKIIKARGIKVEVKSTVGAGDSMVGALAIAIERGYNIEDALKLAAATSTASVMCEGSESGKLEDISKLINEIEISRIIA